MEKANQTGDKKENIYANKHYGAPLLSLFLQNKKTYTYSDIKDYIKATTWSNVLKRKLSDNNIISYKKEKVEGGTHEFTFDKDEFIFFLTKGFIKFCSEQIVIDIEDSIIKTFMGSELTDKDISAWSRGEPIKNVSRKKALLIGRKIPTKKRDAILSVFWCVSDILLSSDEFSKLRQKQRSLTKKLDKLHQDYEKNIKDIRITEGKLTKVTKQMLKESREFIGKQLSTTSIMQIKSLYENSVILKYKNELEEMRPIEIITFMDRILSKPAKRLNLNKKITLYQFFYCLIKEMAIKYENGKQSLKREGEKVLTLCNWAERYNKLVGKYELN